MKYRKLNFPHQEEAGACDRCLSTASSRFFSPTHPPPFHPGPKNPHHAIKKKKKNTDPSRMPQPAPIKAVTQCHICTNNETPEKRCFQAPGYTSPASKNGGPTTPEPSADPSPPHFTPQTQRRFYGGLGKQWRGAGGGRMQARPVPFLLKRAWKANHRTRHSHTCIFARRKKIRLTYGGAYVKLSSATSLIANHRVQTLLTFFPPCPSPR